MLIAFEKGMMWFRRIMADWYREVGSVARRWTSCKSGYWTNFGSDCLQVSGENGERFMLANIENRSLPKQNAEMFQFSHFVEFLFSYSAHYKVFCAGFPSHASGLQPPLAVVVRSNQQFLKSVPVLLGLITVTSGRRRACRTLRIMVTTERKKASWQKIKTNASNKS